jgi:TPR repeat protein
MGKRRSKGSLEVLHPESFKIRWLRAENCMRAKQFANALAIFEELAAEGYSEAYAEIGNILEIQNSIDGSGDLEAARSWYMRAIEEIGDPEAYIGMARLALGGYKNAGNADDAIEYLNIAAKEDRPVALIILGTLYHAGKVLSRDLNKAAEFYTRAINMGYVLPLLYLSKVEFERGHYIAYCRLRMAAFIKAYKLARADRHDPRLWNAL